MKVASFQEQRFQELRSKHKKIINKRVYPRLVGAIADHKPREAHI